MQMCNQWQRMRLFFPNGSFKDASSKSGNKFEGISTILDTQGEEQGTESWRFNENGVSLTAEHHHDRLGYALNFIGQAMSNELGVPLPSLRVLTGNDYYAPNQIPSHMSNDSYEISNILPVDGVKTPLTIQRSLPDGNGGEYRIFSRAGGDDVVFYVTPKGEYQPVLKETVVRDDQGNRLYGVGPNYINTNDSNAAWRTIWSGDYDMPRSDLRSL